MRKQSLKWGMVVLFLLLLPSAAAYAADVTYSYDDLGWLKNVVVQNGYSAGYEYDNVGNRESKTTSALATTAVASLNAIPSSDTDYTVIFDASGSICFNGGTEVQCGLSIDYGGAGTQLGGNGIDTWVYQYTNPGTYTPSLTATENNSGASDSNQLTVSPIAVEVEAPEISFNVTINGTSNTVTLSSTSEALGTALSVTVYWGDRLQTSSNVNNLIGGINHTYARDARTYNIRVEIVFDVDTINNIVNYTYYSNPELSVYIP